MGNYNVMEPQRSNKEVFSIKKDVAAYIVLMEDRNNYL